MTAPSAEAGPIRCAEIFWTFLRIGLSSFGGPVAHVAQFHRELVLARRWVSEQQYGQLVALCQFLPGPATSQVGFSLGLMRGGWRGALSAYCGFTLPSALLMFAFAILLPQFSGLWGPAILHGLKLVAVAVVAHGVIVMGRALCPDWQRLAIAGFAMWIALSQASAWAQSAAIAWGALSGLFLCRFAGTLSADQLHVPYSTRTGLYLLALFFGLLVAALLAPSDDGLGAAAGAFARAGALVFGGGHVVLPLLEGAVVAPGWLTEDEFLAGYGAAQALPGPMFSFAAFLGARLPVPFGGLPGALVALIAIFAPGLLLVSGSLPLWQSMTRHRLAAQAVAGINAAVVGLLAAALYHPVWSSAVHGVIDLLIAGVGFTWLITRRGSAWIVVIWCVAANIARTACGW